MKTKRITESIALSQILSLEKFIGSLYPHPCQLAPPNLRKRLLLQVRGNFGGGATSARARSHPSWGEKK